jgi:hypothetical protein
MDVQRFGCERIAAASDVDLRSVFEFHNIVNKVGLELGNPFAPLNDIYEQLCGLLSIGNIDVISMVLHEIATRNKAGSLVPLHERVGLSYRDHIADRETEHVFFALVGPKVVWSLQGTFQLHRI